MNLLKFWLFEFLCILYNYVFKNLRLFKHLKSVLWRYQSLNGWLNENVVLRLEFEQEVFKVFNFVKDNRWMIISKL